MKYESRMRLTALLSALSLGLTVIAILKASALPLSSSSYLSLYLAALSVVVAASAAAWRIALSHRLARERERRRVFLIYAREDLDAARNLAEELREHGFHPWLDVDEISPGQIWKKAVVNALEESAMALVLVSPHLEKRGFVLEELKTAMETLQEREKGISPVVPVRLGADAKVPEQLAHIQWVNLFEETGLERLLGGLGRIVGST